MSFAAKLALFATRACVAFALIHAMAPAAFAQTLKSNKIPEIDGSVTRIALTVLFFGALVLIRTARSRKKSRSES